MAQRHSIPFRLNRAAGVGRQSEWTSAQGNGILVAGTPQRFDLLTQYVTDNGITAAAMKNYRIDRVIGRVSMQYVGANASYSHGAYGLLVADIASPVTSMDPCLPGSATSWNWMHMDWFQYNLITGDTNVDNSVSHNNARQVRTGRRTKRLLRSLDAHFWCVFSYSGNVAGVRFAYDFRILVSHA